MLKMYAASWCPHCQKAGEHLRKKEVPFEYIEIEEQPEDVVKRVVEANGGDDWVVPTFELDGKWRPGKAFDAEELEKDLRALGVKI